VQGGAVGASVATARWLRRRWLRRRWLRRRWLRRRWLRRRCWSTRCGAGLPWLSLQSLWRRLHGARLARARSTLVPSSRPRTQAAQNREPCPAPRRVPPGGRGL